MAKRRPKVKTYVAAAAYKLDDDGDGGVNLFVRPYDHEPTGAEVLADVFEECDPDWKQDDRYEGMDREKAAEEWEGTLYAAVRISILTVTTTVEVST